MHISDGVLSTPVIAATSIAAVATIAYGLKDVDEEEVPKIALMAGTFFAISLITVPIGPSSVHPLLCGLIGIILGGRSALAFFPALLLQALLFRHGGLTTLGANTFMLFIPAFVSSLAYNRIKIDNTFLKASIIGGLSVIITIIILVSLLVLTDPAMASGDINPVKLLILSHLPLVLVEGLITGGAVQFLEKSNPSWINKE